MGKLRNWAISTRLNVGHMACAAGGLLKQRFATLNIGIIDITPCRNRVGAHVKKQRHELISEHLRLRHRHHFAAGFLHRRAILRWEKLSRDAHIFVKRRRMLLNQIRLIGF